jgi:hypothetical protein
VAGCGRPASHLLKGTALPSADRGLLARLDALVALAADRHGLALVPRGRLAAGLTPATRGTSTTRGPAATGSALAQRDAVELLRAVAEGVGLLRVRGDRLEGPPYLARNRGERAAPPVARFVPRTSG